MRLKSIFIPAIAALLIASGCSSSNGEDAPAEDESAEDESAEVETVDDEEAEESDGEAYGGHTMTTAIEAQGFTCVENTSDMGESLECLGENGVQLQADFFPDDAIGQEFFDQFVAPSMCDDFGQTEFNYAMGSGWLVIAMPNDELDAEIQTTLENVADEAAISVESHTCA